PPSTTATCTPLLSTCCQKSTSLAPFFFFQAEDGIRARNVTGVQTCALPICAGQERGGQGGGHHGRDGQQRQQRGRCRADQREERLLHTGGDRPQGEQVRGRRGGGGGRHPCDGEEGLGVAEIGGDVGGVQGEGGQQHPQQSAPASRDGGGDQ